MRILSVLAHRLIVCLVVCLALTTMARAENPTPYSGTLVVDTGVAFKPFVGGLRDAIKAEGFNIVGLACADCAIKGVFKETVPGNRVFLFFRPDYARRMLAASTAAGIEAPIRVYVTELPDGGARVTYRLPSHVFGAYEVPDLTAMGEELDGRVATLIEQATAAAR